MGERWDVADDDTMAVKVENLVKALTSTSGLAQTD